MPRETRVIYQLADITNVLIPCPDCKKDNSIPWGYDPHVGGRGSMVIRTFSCPHCGSEAVNSVVRRLGPVFVGFKEITALVDDIRLELSDDPTDG